MVAAELRRAQDMEEVNRTSVEIDETVKIEDHPISQAKNVTTAIRWDTSHDSARTNKVVEVEEIPVRGAT